MYVYELFYESTDFEEAIDILKRSFVQEKSQIFICYVLATRTQQAGETLDQYLQALHVLAKDCIQRYYRSSLRRGLY